MPHVISNESLACQTLVNDYSKTNMVTELNKSLAQYMKRIKNSFNKFLTKLAGKKTIGMIEEDIIVIESSDSDSHIEDSSRQASRRISNHTVRYNYISHQNII